MIVSKMAGMPLAQEAVTTQWVDGLMGFVKEDVVPILGAFLILLVGYLVAKIVSSVVAKVFKRTSLDEKLAAAIDVNSSRIGKIASIATFWLVMLFVLIAFFSQLKLPMVS